MIYLWIAIIASVSFGNIEKSKLVGVKINYSIYSEILGEPVQIATLFSEIKEKVQISNRDCYHLILTVQSSPKIKSFYKFTWEYHSYATCDSLISLRYEKWIDSNGKKSHMLINFDQDAGLAEYFNDTVITIPAQTRDFAALIYGIVNLDFDQLVVGDSLKSNVLEEDKKRVHVYSTRVRTKENRTLKINKKEFKCIYLEGVCKADNKKEGTLAKLWVSYYKGKYVPVKIEYGSSKIEIISE